MWISVKVDLPMYDFEVSAMTKSNVIYSLRLRGNQWYTDYGAFDEEITHWYRVQ